MNRHSGRLGALAGFVVLTAGLLFSTSGRCYGETNAEIQKELDAAEAEMTAAVAAAQAAAAALARAQSQVPRGAEGAATGGAAIAGEIEAAEKAAADAAKAIEAAGEKTKAAAAKWANKNNEHTRKDIKHWWEMLYFSDAD